MDMRDSREHREFFGGTAREYICDTQDRHDESAATCDVEIDPFTDEHDIEYWLWDGARLIPASPEESERFREREALLRLSYWQTHIHDEDLSLPTRWHAIVIEVQAALGKLFAHIAGRNI